MARKGDRDLSLQEAERASEGLAIAVRLRVAIELMRAVTASPSASSMPRGATSRLTFDRIFVTRGGAVYAMGPGDSSGAALALWEVLAGRPVGAGRPARLHSIVDDMPPDVDDLVRSAIEAGEDAPSVAQLYDELLAAGEPYAADASEAAARLPWGGVVSDRAAKSAGKRGPGSARGASATPDPVAPRSSRRPPRSRASRPPELELPAPSSRGMAQAAARTSDRSPKLVPSHDAPTNGAAAPLSPVLPPAMPRHAPVILKSPTTLPSMKAVSPPGPRPAPVSSAKTPPRGTPAAAPPAGREAPPSSREGNDRPGSPRVPATLPVTVATRAALQVALAALPPMPSVHPESAVRQSPARPSSRPEPSILFLHAGSQADELVGALRAVGYEVVHQRDAASGLAHAAAHPPMCVVCDAELPDADGEAVVRKLRALGSSIAHTPFMLLAPRATTPKRISRFGAGADVCLIKPIRASLLVKQIDALLDMSSRLRAAHRAVSTMPEVSATTACSGDIRQVGIGVMLTIFEMERRTGTFAASGEHIGPTSARVSVSDLQTEGRLELDLASGAVAGASRSGAPTAPIDVVRAMLRLREGRFVFKPMKARFVDGPRLSEVLAEAARLEDEAAANRTPTPDVGLR